MDDRYDISVDIGDGKDWWYVHGLTTHDEVYELNRQMCDLEIDRERWEKIGKEWDSKKKEIVLSILKGNDMEKKTKKMTKAEAFEYLKGKKVNAKDKDRVVQMKMFDCGIMWRCGESAYYNFGSFLFIDNEGFLSHCGDDEEFWNRHVFEEISADDILLIEIVDEKKKSEEEEALDKISCLGAQIVDILLHMKGHHHVTITETTVALYDEGMCLFHSDPF